MEVTRGHQQFFANNLSSKWDRDVEIGVIAFVSARRIEWCIIWPTWVTEWPCPDLTWGQILTLTFQGQTIHGSTWPWRGKHDGIKIVALPLKLNISSSKNRFGKFWNFDPWWPQFWPEPKNDWYDFEMIVASFRTPFSRFVLRCAGAEIAGVFKHPLPHQVWKIQRPSRARVMIGVDWGW